MALCTGLTKEGNPCTRTGSNETGRCGHHPLEEKNEDKKQLPASQSQTPAGVTRALNEVRREFYTSYMELPALQAKVLECKDLNSLRQLGLMVINALADGTIDPKAGSAITQLLKQQADLIERTQPKDNKLDATGRKAAVEISLKMDQESAWALMQDFTGGFAKLTKTAMQQIAEVPIDVTPIEQPEKISEPIRNENLDSKRVEREVSDTASPSEEIF